MRKALILAVAGVFFSSGAMACGWGAKSASKGTDNQTVMTDHGQSGQTATPKTSKTDTKG